MNRVYTAFALLSGSNGADRLARAAAAGQLPEPLSGRPRANTPSSHGGGRLALTALYAIAVRAVLPGRRS